MERMGFWRDTILPRSLTWGVLCRLGGVARASVTARLLLRVGGGARQGWAAWRRPLAGLGEALKRAVAGSRVVRLVTWPEEPERAVEQLAHGSVMVRWCRSAARPLLRGWHAWRPDSLVFGRPEARGDGGGKEAPRGARATREQGGPGDLWRLPSLGWALIIALAVNLALVLLAGREIALWGVFGRAQLLLLGLLCLGWQGDARDLFARSLTRRLLLRHTLEVRKRAPQAEEPGRERGGQC
ncbi:MAG: hypothetical protein HYY96_06205 [Candidatus Tectomicrobia bacterium]|nr:hypothetical protein [Candidatus Tectomicrobia bacterium]